MHNANNETLDSNTTNKNISQAPHTLRQPLVAAHPGARGDDIPVLPERGPSSARTRKRRLGLCATGALECRGATRETRPGGEDMQDLKKQGSVCKQSKGKDTHKRAGVLLQPSRAVLCPSKKQA